MYRHRRDHNHVLPWARFCPNPLRSPRCAAGAAFAKTQVAASGTPDYDTDAHQWEYYERGVWYAMPASTNGFLDTRLAPLTGQKIFRTLNPKPQTPNPKPSTLNPKP